MTKFDQDLISGSVTRSVWKLAWPVILAHLVSGIHGFIDQALVGHFVPGHGANGGIGVAWQVFLVVIVFIASLFQGMSIMIARYAGKQDYENVNRTAFGVFMASLYLLLFVVGPIGYLMAPELLLFTNVTPEVYEHALPYLRISFVMGAPIFMMFMFNGMFMASGTPKLPLMLNAITTVNNIALSYVLITGAGPFPAMGTAGAALGTCLGPLPSMVLAFYFIKTGKAVVGLPKKLSLAPDWPVLREAARIGMPTGIQGVMLNIGGIILLRFINTLYDATHVMYVYVICYSQLIEIVTWDSFGIRNSSSALMGQNIGAGVPERGARAIYVAALFGASWAAFWWLLYTTVPGALLGIFNAHDGETLRLGAQFLRYLTLSAFLLIVCMAFTGGLQGAGDTRKPMYIAFVSQIVVLLGVCWIYQTFFELRPSSNWTAIVCAHASRFVMTLVVFRAGTWKNIQVGIREHDSPAEAGRAEKSTA